jgi:peptide/nickel transport system permease protein
MLRYVTGRVLQGVAVIFLVSFATFGLLQLAPGSPVDILIDDARVAQAQIDAIKRKWGPDQPRHVQYLTWLGNIATGDFGQSVIRSGTPVGQMLREAAPVTLRLNGLALLISTAVAVSIGIISRDPALPALRLREHAARDTESSAAGVLGGADGDHPLLARCADRPDLPRQSL